MELVALKGFATKNISAMQGQEFSCPNEVAKDLLGAGYAKKKTKSDAQPDNEPPPEPGSADAEEAG